jgi:hypothetical protein
MSVSTMHCNSLGISSSSTAHTSQCVHVRRKRALQHIEERVSDRILARATQSGMLQDVRNTATILGTCLECDTAMPKPTHSIPGCLCVYENRCTCNLGVAMVQPCVQHTQTYCWYPTETQDVDARLRWSDASTALARGCAQRYVLSAIRIRTSVACDYRPPPALIYNHCCPLLSHRYLCVSVCCKP